MESIMLDRIKILASEMKSGMIDFAQRLIRCPSLTGEEKDVSDILLKELDKLGYNEIFRDDWGNIVGIIHGTKPGPTIMFNGHMDHVDVGATAEWMGYDPYSGVIDVAEIYNETGTELEKTEVIHGRAAADTKCGIACQVYSGAILIRLKKEGFDFSGDYMVSCVVMEEPGEQIGMTGLYEDTFPKKGLQIDGVVSCESTSLKIYCGHRGRVELNVEVSGITSHGAAPWLGVNAVLKATKLIEKVEEKFAKEYKIDEKLGKASIALTVISCSPGAMCVVPDRCNVIYDRRLVPTETPEDALNEIQRIIDDLTAEDPDFRARVTVSATPRKTYTGKTVTLPNIKEGWRIDEDHPFVIAASNALRSIGEPVAYGYWDFGTDLAMICGRHHIAAIGYSPMQEFYCHRPVDKCRIDFMNRALVGNISIFTELTQLKKDDFKL